MTTERSPSGFRWRVFPAVAIIAIGVLFLVGNLGVDLRFFEQQNWWAWFILVGALAPLTGAWEAWHRRGRFNAEVAHCLLASAAVVLVAAMFLLDLDWALWWPLFVILGGLFTLLPQQRYHRHCGWYDGGNGDAVASPHPGRR